MKTLHPLVLSFVPLLAACSAAAPTASPTPGTETSASAGARSLARAHEAYLTDDLLSMTRSLRTVLSDDTVDPDVRDNALALLDAAYTHAGGKLPADWSLPAGFHTLNFGQMRVEEPSVTQFSVWLSGHVDEMARILGLSVKHGDDVLLDLASGRGKLKVEKEKDGDTYFSFSSDEGAHPIGPGVYDVRIELRGEAALVGWVIVGDVIATAAPRIHTPLAGSYVGSNPTVSFEDFRSPGYRPFEERTLWIGVSRAKEIEWSLWTGTPGFTEVVVGKDERGGGGDDACSGPPWARCRVHRAAPLRADEGEPRRAHAGAVRRPLIAVSSSRSREHRARRSPSRRLA